MVFKASLKRRLSAKAVWTSGASRCLGFGSKARGSARRCSSPGESRGGASRKALGRLRREVAEEVVVMGGSRGRWRRASFVDDTLQLATTARLAGERSRATA
jgi:hypothetical protein